MKKTLSLTLVCFCVSLSLLSFAKAGALRCRGVFATPDLANNPFLKPTNLPLGAFPYDQYRMEHFIPAIDIAISRAESRIQTIAETKEQATFRNTVLAFQYMDVELEVLGKVLSTYSATMTNPEVREAYAYYQERAVDLSSKIFTNKKLYLRFKEVYEKQTLDATQGRLVKRMLQSFEDQGVSLPEQQQAEFLSLKRELAKIAQQFEDNLTDYGSPENFLIVVTDAKQLAGLPQSVVQQAAELALQNHKKGWAFGSTGSTYQAIMKFAESEDLRYRMWLKSEREGNEEGPYYNHDLLRRIVAIQHHMARILGYQTFGHKVLQQRMAQSPAEVMKFLNDLLVHVLPQAKREIAEISDYRTQQTGETEPLKPWQTTLWGRKLKEARYNFDAEQLKPYFEVQSTLRGAFTIAKKLYNLDFVARTDLPVYEPTVQVFEVRRAGVSIGLLYADLYSRPGSKRGGAWMSDLRPQDRDPNGQRITPVVSINLNIHKNSQGPTLLTVDEVTTLFHEFGHGLHGLLSNVTYVSHASPNVFWDFVELPSQFMENYVFHRDSLDLFAAHHESGQKIPEDLFNAFMKSRNFASGIGFLGQLRLAYLDMAWYTEAGLREVASVRDFEEAAIGHLKILPRFHEQLPQSPSFSHIFGGGYAAGYYSYKWAEVLEADAFAAFREAGDLFHPTYAQRMESLLAAGGSEDPAVLFRNFRGRDPDVKALLEREGIEVAP